MGTLAPLTVKWRFNDRPRANDSSSLRNMILQYTIAVHGRRFFDF